MNTHRSPATVAPPFSSYSHSVEVPPNARWVHISGQVGVRPDGGLPTGMAGQCAQAWHNVLAVLDDAGMTNRDLVKVSVFLTSGTPEDVAAYREARDEAIGTDTRPASTLLIVKALAHPDWQVEIEAIAARA